MVTELASAMVINDHQLVTDLLDRLLVELGVKIIRSFPDPQSALPHIVMNPPALVLIDMILPVLRTIKGQQADYLHPYVLMDSQIALHAVQEIRNRCPRTKVLMISGERHPRTFLLGFEVGAQGVASKLDDLSSFADILQRVLKGEERVTSPRVQELIAQFIQTPQPVLTGLERQILELAQEGLDSPQIAHELGYASKTIRNHISDINRKLGTSNRFEAVEVAIEMGLIGWRIGHEGN